MAVETIRLKIPGLSCGSCERKIRALLTERFASLIATVEYAEGSSTSDVTFDLAEKTVTIRLAVERFDYSQMVEAIEALDPVKYRCEVLQAPGGIERDVPAVKKTSSKKSNSSRNPSRSASITSTISSKSSSSSKLKKPSSKTNSPKAETKRKAVMTVGGMTCSSCVATIENRLNAVEGIYEAVVALMACRAEVTYDPTVAGMTAEAIAEMIEDMGFTTSALQTISFGSGDNPEDAKTAEIQLAVMGVTGESGWAAIEAAVSALEGVTSVQVAPEPQSRLTVSYQVGVIGPRKVVDTIGELEGGYSAYPSNADLREREISIDLVEKGDLLRVRPGERIPVDGKVVEGAALVNESLVTGESLPTAKAPGAALLAGSILQNGTLLMVATNVGRDTTLAAIVAMVQEAQATKAPIQALADRVAAFFVPLVVVLSVLSLAAWLVLGQQLFEMIQALNPAFYAAMPRREVIIQFAFQIALSVLTISCPCALGLATPTAVMVGTGIGAMNGILIKGSEALESAQKVTTVVFD
ncbi:PREDICTED: copper-transporting ATPase 1-like, partial [Rhagoletis zephyria]|uniref:copper-transporting ATPase 1-like n=1 Tax=Rhagoletis zephyria TaxID=28612 RepID=UPI00081129BA